MLRKKSRKLLVALKLKKQEVLKFAHAIWMDFYKQVAVTLYQLENCLSQSVLDWIIDLITKVQIKTIDSRSKMWFFFNVRAGWIEVNDNALINLWFVLSQTSYLWLNAFWIVIFLLTGRITVETWTDWLRSFKL